MTPLSDLVEYKRVGGNSCIHYFTLKMATALSSEMLVPYHITTRYHNPEDSDVSRHHRENFKSRFTEVLSKGNHEIVETSENFGKLLRTTYAAPVTLDIHCVVVVVVVVVVIY
jgi:hypothetical protein